MFIINAFYMHHTLLDAIHANDYKTDCPWTVFSRSKYLDFI